MTKKQIGNWWAGKIRGIRFWLWDISRNQKDGDALKQEKVTDGLALRSNQGSKHTSQAYFDLSQERHFALSMSSHGCPYDNAVIEDFFCALKTECLYRFHFSFVKELFQLIAEYIHFNNLSVFRSKTALPLLKSGARPRKLFSFYFRFFLSDNWDTVQRIFPGKHFGFMQHSGAS